MMTVQSDRYTKPVFQFFMTVFGFGFFQEPPQPLVHAKSWLTFLMLKIFLENDRHTTYLGLRLLDLRDLE